MGPIGTAGSRFRLLLLSRGSAGCPYACVVGRQSALCGMPQSVTTGDARGWHAGIGIALTQVAEKLGIWVELPHLLAGLADVSDEAAQLAAQKVLSQLGSIPS